MENKIYTGAARGARVKYEVCVFVELFRVVTDYYLGLLDNMRKMFATQYYWEILPMHYELSAVYSSQSWVFGDDKACMQGLV